MERKDEYIQGTLYTCMKFFSRNEKKKLQNIKYTQNPRRKLIIESVGGSGFC